MTRITLILISSILWLVSCHPTTSYPPGTDGIGDSYYPQLGNGFPGGFGEKASCE